MHRTVHDTLGCVVVLRKDNAMNIINGIRFNDRIYSHHGNETASTKGFVARQSRSGQQVWKPVGLILGEGDESLLPEMQ